MDRKIDRTDRGRTQLPASDVAEDEGRSDNTGVGGIATFSIAAGFLLVIMLQAELSILL